MRTNDTFRATLLATLAVLAGGVAFAAPAPTAEAACLVGINTDPCEDCIVSVGTNLGSPATCTGTCAVSIGVPLSGVTPGGSCGGACLVSVGDCNGLGFCEVNVNHCNGDCTVNVGACSVLGGKCTVTVGECYSRCTVNVGTCFAGCTINVGVCPSGDTCTLSVNGCILLPAAAQAFLVHGGHVAQVEALPAASEARATVDALLP